MKDDPLKVEKLSDELGAYEIMLKCEGCKYMRVCRPQILAALSKTGWDTNLEALTKKMRCSKCGARKCTAKLSRSHMLNSSRR